MPPLAGRHLIGTQVTFTLVLTPAEASAPVDAGSVKLTIVRPGGATNEYLTGDFAKPAAGTYKRDVPLDAAGEWSYRAETTGHVAVAEGVIVVVASALPAQP